jgi:Flp pilus assembly protein TadG
MSGKVEDTMRARLRRDERGMSLVFVSLGFVSFMAATTLAIDIGMFMTARSQIQNAADAGALAGAVALYYNDYNNRSSSGPAVQSAINTSIANVIMGSGGSVTPADVTFPTSPSGENNRVRVTVRRGSSRGNPVATLFGPLLGVNTVDVIAVATAEAAPANAATCVKPFTIPDKWIETTTPPWDPDDDFDMNDIYIPPGQSGATGYNATTDKGLQVALKENNHNKTAPSFYNPWAMPGGTGGSWYRSNISGCNTSIIPIGQLMTAEPGNKVGPTLQGTQDLIDQDPNAYWDTSCDCVKGSAFGKSPRITVVPLYDPIYYETGKQNGRNADLKVANFLGFFIEGMQSKEVIGRVMPVTALIQGSAGPAPIGAFAKVIRLVE